MSWNSIIQRLAGLRGRSVVLLGLAGAAAFELITVAFRFGLGMESTRDTSALAAVTFGLRIHHGYLGVLLLLAAWPLARRPAWRNALVIVGLTLVVSDLVHHFVVLWSVTGSPEFDLWYSGQNR
jgi:hypothetical protein